MSRQAPPRRLPGWTTWLVRAASAAMAIAGVWVGWQKFRPSEEQAELTRYVELQVPAFLERERAIYARLDRLSATPGPSPAEARALLVDDVIPRVIALRQLAAAVVARAASLRAVNDEYLAALDKLLEACRVSVRAIDDPAAAGAGSSQLVRRRFFEAGEASRAWSAHLRDACVRARLAGPPYLRAVGAASGAGSGARLRFAFGAGLAGGSSWTTPNTASGIHRSEARSRPRMRRGREGFAPASGPSARTGGANASASASTTHRAIHRTR